MEYSKYDIVDFLKDKNFVEWTTNPTEDQSFFWNTWLSKHPDKRDVVLKAKELIGSVKPKNNKEPSEDEFLQVLEKVMKSDASDMRSINHSLGQNIQKIMIKLAVAATVIIAVFIGLSKLNDTNKILNGVIPVSSDISMVHKKTLSGQKIVRHVLPDGSVISLNGASTLSYSEKFSKNKREVYLEGEAFFDVKRDVNRPFLIHANGTVTRVLGTSFNINAYSSENIVEIAVLSGKVAVYPKRYDETAENQEMLLLDPKEKATINTESNEVLKGEAHIENIISWKENILIFHNDSFDNMVNKLERWYGVEFRLATNATPKGKWNGRFENKSLEYVLNGLMFSSDAHFKIDDKMVYVTDKK